MIFYSVAILAEAAPIINANISACMNRITLRDIFSGIGSCLRSIVDQLLEPFPVDVIIQAVVF